jgi:hypothetical protein
VPFAAGCYFRFVPEALLSKIFFIALACLLLAGRHTHAEESPPNCGQDYVECTTRAQTLVNDVEASDARAECTRAMGACNRKLDHFLQEKEREQLEKQDEKAQGDDTTNGNIKTYRFDN